MADMTNTRLELCNMIRMEAEHISDTGFPLDVFPQAVQSVILDMDRYENYKTEFIATAMLSAVSAALGGTYRIRIKGEWQSNAALYIILVGRPGLGKTPPLEAAYRPIRKHDYALFRAYESELEAWKAAGESGRKPVLRRTVVSDFTPESLLLTHNSNPRSVVILGRDNGHVQLRQPLHQRATHRAAAHGMERRGTGCDKGQQHYTCAY